MTKDERSPLVQTYTLQPPAPAKQRYLVTGTRLVKEEWSVEVDARSPSEAKRIGELAAMAYDWADFGYEFNADPIDPVQAKAKQAELLEKLAGQEGDNDSNTRETD